MKYGLGTELNGIMDTFMQEREPDYRKRIILWETDLPVRDFCGNYGMTTRKMNKWLQDHGIQFRVNGEWIPKPILEKKGYVICGYEEFRGRTGYVYPHSINYWTPAGRAFLYDFMKFHGLVPLEESDSSSDDRHTAVSKRRTTKESAYA